MAALLSRRRRQYSGFRVRHLAGAVLTALPVFRIRSDLLAVIVGAPLLLALRLVADRLPRLKLRGLENPPTIATPPFDHTGVVALTVRRRI